ncbi:aspartyl protease family protein [Amphritea sp. 1_MG-2023]|uniref:aspartyl protease family protein n=1 Tax=Amphritea sp. 1_MG-2023 TaxID=3062670 RepID=UPI0026E219EF|nr:aspartyl protease family protein [Amphritea sp. 1_MG-2023]MDO6564956.1 aspartyl protease family protein [Amphritea sp. 1_MG-2023]
MSRLSNRYALFLGLLWLVSASASAEILHYIDANGRKVYVDSAHKIPIQYRQQSQSITTERQTDAQKQASEENRQQQSDAFRRKQQIRQLETTIEKMTTPVKIIGNQVLVPVNVVWRGRKANLNLLLDTGASMTVLHRDGVSSLNISSRNSGYAQVAGGGLIKTDRVVFDRIEMGPYKVENKSTAVIENRGQQSFDGLLGMDMLGGGDYSVDFGQRQIIWAPAKYEQLTDALKQLKLIHQQASADKTLVDNPASMKKVEPSEPASSKY